MNRFTLSICLASMLAAPIAQAADEEDRAAHHPGADQSRARDRQHPCHQDVPRHAPANRREPARSAGAEHQKESLTPLCSWL